MSIHEMFHRGEFYSVSVHANCLRAAFCVSNVLKSILKRYMVEAHALKRYPETSVSDWDKLVSGASLLPHISIFNM